MSARSDALRAMLGRLITYKVLDWQGNSSASDVGDAKDRVCRAIDKSDVVSSQLLYTLGSATGGKHMVVLDIDHPAWLVKSSTPDHHHLYIEVPGGIDWIKYGTMLMAMADAGVIEPGYVRASLARKHTSVRLPWVRKEQP